MSSKNSRSDNNSIFENNSLYGIYQGLPEFVKEKFRDLGKNFPSFSKHTLAWYEGITKRIQLESVLKVDSSRTFGEIVPSEIARATDEARENPPKPTTQTTANQRRRGRALQEDGVQFTRELQKALNSAFLFHSEDNSIPDNLKFLVLSFIQQTVQEDEILNGNNSLTESTGKAISIGMDKLRPIGISNDTKIPLTTSVLPYSFIEDIDSKEICRQIHDILIQHKKIKCSIKEFSKHLVQGEISDKIVWYGKDIELAWIHKLMQGGSKDLSIRKILNTHNIHKLTCAHFMKSNGREFNPKTLSAALARIEFNPSQNQFLCAFAGALEKLA